MNRCGWSVASVLSPLFGWIVSYLIIFFTELVQRTDSLRLIVAAAAATAGFFVLPAMIGWGCSYLCERYCEGSHWSIRPRPRVILSTVVASCLLGVAVGLAFSKMYWGYYFQPPALFDEVRSIQKVMSLTHYEGVLASQKTASKTLYSSSLRVDHVLRELHKLPPQLPSSAEALRRVNELFIARDPDLLGPILEKENYRGFGSVVEYIDSNNTRMYLLQMDLGQVSNDHHEYYEMLFNGDAKGGRLVKAQGFFHDVAGIEGFDWKVAAVMVAYLILIPAILASVWIPNGRGSAGYR